MPYAIWVFENHSQPFKTIKRISLAAEMISMRSVGYKTIYSFRLLISPVPVQLHDFKINRIAMPSFCVELHIQQEKQGKGKQWTVHIPSSILWSQRMLIYLKKNFVSSSEITSHVHAIIQHGNEDSVCMHCLLSFFDFEEPKRKSPMCFWIFVSCKISFLLIEALSAIRKDLGIV